MFFVIDYALKMTPAGRVEVNPSLLQTVLEFIEYSLNYVVVGYCQWHKDFIVINL